MAQVYLKRLYGVGYSFTIGVNADIPIRKVRDEIHELITNKIPTAQLLSIHGAEFIYRLPFKTSKQFPSMFRLIDDKKDILHIDSYGISVTTLEEVFIKVGHGQTSADDMTDEVREFKRVINRRRSSSDLSQISEEIMKRNRNSDPNVAQVAVVQVKEARARGNVEEIEMKNMDLNADHDHDHDQDSDHQAELLQMRWSQFLDQVRDRSQKNLFGIHLYAMLYKKFHYTKRDKRVKYDFYFYFHQNSEQKKILYHDRAFLCQFFPLLLFMFFGFAVINLEAPETFPRLKLDMDHFDESTIHKIRIINNRFFVNPFPDLWSNSFQSIYGDLVSIDGGDNGFAYNYDNTTYSTPTALRTYFDSLLAISDQEPFKYVSLYFPIHNTSINGMEIDSWRHIGIGANISAFHSLPISTNIANNLTQSISTSAKIDVYIQPLPTTKTTAAAKQFEALIYSTYLAFGLAFFPVGIMYGIVYERENLSKLQLLVSGVHSIAYWLGNYIFDAITILPSCLFAILLVYGFDATPFIDSALLPFILILFLYAVSIVPFTYLFSWLFNKSTRAQYMALITYIFLGYGFSLATFIMDIFENTRNASKTLSNVLYVTMQDLNVTKSFICFFYYI